MMTYRNGEYNWLRQPAAELDKFGMTYTGPQTKARTQGRTQKYVHRAAHKGTYTGPYTKARTQGRTQRPAKVMCVHELFLYLTFLFQ